MVVTSGRVVDVADGRVEGALDATVVGLGSVVAGMDGAAVLAGVLVRVVVLPWAAAAGARDPPGQRSVIATTVTPASHTPPLKTKARRSVTPSVWSRGTRHGWKDERFAGVDQVGIVRVG